MQEVLRTWGGILSTNPQKHQRWQRFQKPRSQSRAFQKKSCSFCIETSFSIQNIFTPQLFLHGFGCASQQQQIQSMAKSWPNFHGKIARLVQNWWFHSAIFTYIYIYLYIWYAIHTLYSTYTQQTTKDEPFHHPKQKKDLENMQSCWHCSHRPRSPGTTRCRSMSRFVGDGAAPWIPYDIFFGSLVAEGGLVKKRKKTIWRDYHILFHTEIIS